MGNISRQFQKNPDIDREAERLFPDVATTVKPVERIEPKQEEPPVMTQQKNENLKRPAKQEAKKKVSISIRLDPDELEAWRSTGMGWQIRMREVLRKNAPKKGS